MINMDIIRFHLTSPSNWDQPLRKPFTSAGNGAWKRSPSNEGNSSTTTNLTWAADPLPPTPPLCRQLPDGSNLPAPSAELHLAANPAAETKIGIFFGGGGAVFSLLVYNSTLFSVVKSVTAVTHSELLRSGIKG